MTITRFLQIAARSWRRSLAVALLVGAGVGAFVLLQPVRYTATSSVYLTAADPTSGSDLNQSSAFISKEMASYAILARSEAVMTNVVRNKPDLGLTPAELAATIQVTVPPESSIVQIAAEHPDPETARQVANLTASGLTVAVRTRQNSAGRIIVAANQVGVAETPTDPSSPDPLLAAAAAAAAAAATFAAAALGSFVLDRRITSRAGAGRAAGTSVLADFAALDRPGALERLTGPSAELVNNLSFMEVCGPIQVLGVADTCPGQGAPMVAANLALEIARRGRSRVALVDLNLTGPAIGDRLGLPAAPGVTDVLGRGPISFAGHETPEGLDVFVAGTHPPNPAELLASTALASELDVLRAEYSTVVVVTPTLDTMSALDVSSRLDGVIVVARLGSATEPGVEAAAAALAGAGIRNLGVVTTHRAARKMSGRGSGPRRKDAR